MQDKGLGVKRVVKGQALDIPYRRLYYRHVHFGTQKQ
jgi:hypothetical protein